MTQSRETSACELQALALREGWDFDLADQAHLRRGAASSLSADDAGELFCALSGPHDFWWPLVVGTRPLRNVLVLEDTWGSLAVRLSEIADRVCALFLTEPDASLLRRSRVATNVEVHVAATLVSAPLWQEKWDLIVLQRPAATDLGELRRCAVRSLSENGSVVIVDEFRATASTALFKGEGERVRWSEFNDLRQPSHAYVSHAPIRAQLMNLPDLRLRRSRTCAGAAIEGTREHGLRRRALLNYVRPVSVLAVSHRADTYVRQILDADRIRALSPGEPMIVKRLLAGNEDTTVMLVGSKSDSDCKVVLRAAHRARARRRVQHNADVLKSLAQFKLPFAVPALLATFEDSPGVFISAESCLPGAVLLSVSAGQAKQAYMRRAIEKWNLFRSAHAVDSAVGNDDYVRLIGTAFEKIQRYTSREDENRIEQLDALLRAALASGKWSLGPTHGDFKVGNILVDRQGDVGGVIDWDCWESRGLPLMDVMTLCVYEDARELKRHLGQSIARGLFLGDWSRSHNELIERERVDHGLSPHELNALKVAFWAINLRDRIHWLALSIEDEAIRHLREPAEHALRLLERG